MVGKILYTGHAIIFESPTAVQYKSRTVHIKIKNEDYLEGSYGHEKATYG